MHRSFLSPPQLHTEPAGGFCSQKADVPPLLMVRSHCHRPSPSALGGGFSLPVPRGAPCGCEGHQTHQPSSRDLCKAHGTCKRGEVFTVAPWPKSRACRLLFRLLKYSARCLRAPGEPKALERLQLKGRAWCCWFGKAIFSLLVLNLLVWYQGPASISSAPVLNPCPSHLHGDGSVANRWFV